MTKAATNQAPICKWFGTTMACGTRRQRLYVNGQETPFFIDSAKGVLAHRTQGFEHGLFGSGMHPAGIAATLGSGRSIAALKHRAEQMALAA